MKLDELKQYKRILILGYGAEGQATERFLKKYHPAAEIGIADQKDGPDYLDEQKHYDLAVRTPLLRPHKVTIPYTTGTNLFFGNVTQPIIGITATKGKSSTVSMLHNVLLKAGFQSRLHGNIGIPMLDALTEGIDAKDIFVLELSSYQLEDIQYSPDIACFMNIHEEKHNHTDFDEYFEAKTHITTYQKQDDVFLYNGADQAISQVAENTHAQTQDFTIFDVKPLLKDIDISFHTHEDNLKVVWAIASYLGAEEEHFVDGIRTFEPLPHRLNLIGSYDDVEYYDDGYAFNPLSTIFALDEIPGVTSVILGGEERYPDWQPLAEKLAEKNVAHVILLPDSQEKIYNEILALDGYNPDVQKADTMDEAVKYAHKVSNIGSVVLFSPGAPSYNMYANGHERAQDYIRTIKKYATKKKNATRSSKGSSEKKSKNE